MHFIAKSLAGFGTVVYYSKVNNAKNRSFCKEKMGFECSFFYIKLKGIWLQTGLLDLKKHQTIEILLRVDISAFVF